MSGPINHIFEDGDDDYTVVDVDDYEAIMSHEEYLSDQVEQAEDLEADWLADEVDVPEDLEGFDDEFAWADTDMGDEEY